MSEIKTIGVVIADECEFVPFVSAAEKLGGKKTTARKRNLVEFDAFGKRIIGAECGIGKVNAATATSLLIHEYKVDAVLNIGLSGAVSGLRQGDIVAGKSYVECDFDLRALGKKLGEKPQDRFVYAPDENLFEKATEIDGVGEAVCGCGDIFLTDKELKQLYRDTFSITEFDMETGAIASVCFDYDIPFLSIRRISDDADDASSETYTAMNEKCEKTLTEILLKLVEKI